MVPQSQRVRGEFSSFWLRQRIACLQPALVRMAPLDAQCVLNAETNDRSTMRYSPISKDRMLSSPTHLEDQPQPPTPAAMGPGPGPDICATQRKGKSRSNSKSHSLFSNSSSLAFASAGAVAALESEGRGNTGAADSPRQRSSFSGQNPRAWIAAQRPPVRSS